MCKVVCVVIVFEYDSFVLANKAGRMRNGNTQANGDK